MQRSEESIIKKDFGFIGLISYIKNPLSLYQSLKISIPKYGNQLR